MPLILTRKCLSAWISNVRRTGFVGKIVIVELIILAGQGRGASIAVSA
jgi:hypothetical protein